MFLHNINIGSNIIIESESLVTKDISSKNIYCGNLAKFVSFTAAYVEKNKKLMENSGSYGEEPKLIKNIKQKNKVKITNDLENNIKFVD